MKLCKSAGTANVDPAYISAARNPCFSLAFWTLDLAAGFLAI
jgi:hypothetical protein